MRKSIAAAAWAWLATALLAHGGDAEREWREVRRQLEKQGVKVDHFAKTPEERERELANIRRQLEKANDPARGKSMRSIGGAAAAPRVIPQRPSRRLSSAGPLGARRRL